MKNWMRNTLIISLAFNCAFIGAFVYRWIEQTRKHKLITMTHQIIMDDENPSHIQVLQLDDTQIDDLKIKRHSFHPKVESLRVDLRKHREKLGGLLSDSLLDTLDILKQVDSIGTLQTQMEKEVVIQLLDEKKVLDPEQQEYFVDVMLNHLGCDSSQCKGGKIKIIKKRLHTNDKKEDVIEIKDMTRRNHE